jgi:hypothetical protein
VKSIVGELPITEKQAKKLEIKPGTQMNPNVREKLLALKW